MTSEKPGMVSPGESGAMIRLSHNESAYGPSPKAVAAYRSVSGRLNRYPDGAQYELRRALADVHKLDIDRIICGSGSEELLGLLIRAYLGEGDGLLLTEHHFTMCSVYGRAQGVNIVQVPVDDYRINIAAILEQDFSRLPGWSSSPIPMCLPAPAWPVRKLRELHIAACLETSCWSLTVLTWNMPRLPSPPTVH